MKPGAVANEGRCDAMSIGIDVKVVVTSTAEQIQKEVETDVQRQLFAGNAVVKVHEAVVTELRDVLGFHIRHDVYEAYTPTGEVHYKRRKDNGDFGTSLLKSADKDHAESIFDLEHGGRWKSGIRYEPTAEHENWRWSDPDLKPDELIGRIEKKEPQYNFNPIRGEIPDRPFWQDFVTEMIEGGRFASTLEKILKEQGIAEPSDTITGITRDSSDGNY